MYLYNIVWIPRFPGFEFTSWNEHFYTLLVLIQTAKPSLRDIGVVRISSWTDGVERGSESEISELLVSAGGRMELERSQESEISEFLESAGGRMELKSSPESEISELLESAGNGWSRKKPRVRDIGVVRISRWTDGVERGSESEISELLESAGGQME